MAKGIIYLMTTAVPGLVKIGKTGSNNFEQRMYILEHNGYRNVTALKRAFAIEVEDYDEKEALLHTIFEKSQLADTELFAIDENIVKQLLSSFDGTMIYPKSETKNEVFGIAAESSTGKIIPDGTYTFKRKKKAENKTISAAAAVINGYWTLKKGSTLSMTEGVGVAQNVKAARASMPFDNEGKLLEDVELGACSPSYAADVVLYQSCNGWTEWKNGNGEPIDIYRKKISEE